MKNSIFSMGVLAFLAVTTLFVSCSKDDDDQQQDEIAQMIDEVRAVTQTYTSFDAGVAAGWATDLSGCVEHPTEGGMGHHYGRLEYIDGRNNHLEPQVLLYVPDENGNMEFVAIEYMIPFSIISKDEEPPMLFDQHYHPNEEIEMWTLHLWSEKENPKGMFYDWNPNVSCN